jgi:hypothetical protein
MTTQEDDPAFAAKARWENGEARCNDHSWL